MSLGEITELYSTLQEIDVMLSKIEVRTVTLKTEVGHGAGQLREFEYILYRTTALLSRMHLPKEIDSAISMLQRMIITVRILHSSMIMLESTTPYGWILAGLSLLSGIIIGGTSIAQEISSYGGG
jgi:hypothetical protein